MMPAGAQRVVVVGGGISGLSAAHRLVESGLPRTELQVLEASERAGGTVRSERTDDCLLEAGPDKLVTYKPAGVALCKRLGLEAELVHPPLEIVARGKDEGARAGVA